MQSAIQPAVVGASGYAGFELVRLLLRHPRVKKPVLFAREGDGDAARLDDLYPHIRGNGGYPMEPFSWEAVAKKGVNVLFMATPHEISRAWAPQALEKGVHVIDLSGAWRLACPASREVYRFKDSDPDLADQLTTQAVYGIPELHRGRLKEAALVANAGCYATSIILALSPLVRAGLVDIGHGIICDSKSGVSGAGKQPT